MIICQHDQLKRQCPLCDLEEENAALKQEIEQLNMRVAENVGKALRFYNENEQLNADKAALLECVKWYADRNNYVMDPETKFRPAAWDSGDLARECLAQIGGTQ